VPRPQISIFWMTNTAIAVPHRTALHFTLSEPAAVTVTLERVKRSKTTPAGALPAFDGKAGANRQFFDGRVGGKALHKGRYRATMVATNAAGIASAPATLSFKIAAR
jgi:hypothetical protein